MGFDMMSSKLSLFLRRFESTFIQALAYIAQLNEGKLDAGPHEKIAARGAGEPPG